MQLEYTHAVLGVAVSKFSKISLAEVVNGLLITVLVLNALALSIFVGSIGVGQFPLIMQNSPAMFQDFVKYYSCGRVALSGKKKDAYEQEVQTQAIQEVLAPYVKTPLPEQYKFPTDYPPPVYAVMSAVALLPLDMALFAFLLLSIISTSAGAYLLAGKDWRKASIWILWIAVCVLSWRTLAMGQMTWLIMGMMAMFFYFFLTRRDVVCGLILSVVTLKIQYAVFLLVPVLICRRWKALVSWFVPLLLLFIVTYAFLGADFIAGYPQVIKRIEGSDPYIKSMMCVRAMGSVFCPPDLLAVLTIASMIIGVVVCATAWMLAKDRSVKAQKWAAALTICVALLASPHTHSYDSLLLAVAALLTLPTLDPFVLFHQQPLAMRIWSACLLTFPLTSWLLFKLPPGQVVLQAAAFFFFTLVLAVLAGFNLKRSLHEGSKEPA